MYGGINLGLRQSRTQNGRLIAGKSVRWKEYHFSKAGYEAKRCSIFKMIQRTTISIKTYLRILDIMKRDLQTKWDKNDKVGSLQISIQSCKLLHDTSNAVGNLSIQKFHALKFAYVLEIVEKFGIQVFERIKMLSFPNLPNERIQQIAIKDL